MGHYSGRARPVAALILFLALVALVPAPARGATITVAALQTAAKYPRLHLAQAKPADGDKSAVAFEEPGVLAPEAQAQPGDSFDDGCSPRTGGGELPRVAIIIDDMGYHRDLGEALLALAMNLTFSFLPHAPFAREQSEKARRQGHDILVHMPMEARDARSDPGPGTLFLGDPLPELSRKVAQNLALVPHAIGINNHMGSRFTEDEAAMQRFFSLLAGQDLLFIDSGTSSRSLAMETARGMGFRSARRHVFLDNVQSQEDICRQLKLLVREAERRGWAIGIGHPNQATLTALTRCRTMLQSRVQLVGIGALAR